MVEAVIFDWAGTTVDYGCFAPVRAFVETFKNKGIEVTLDEVRKPMGALKRDHIAQMLEMPRIQQIFLSRYNRLPDQEDIDDMLQMFTKKLMAELDQHTTIKPYVKEAVQLLREKCIKIGSTTGYTTAMLLPVKESAARLGYAPDVVVTPDDTGGVGRPASKMIEKNLQLLGVTNPKHVIKIGDTISDIEEGINAGVFTVGVIEGSSLVGLSEAEYESLSDQEKSNIITKTEAAYKAAGAHAIILHLGQLENLLETLQTSS